MQCQILRYLCNCTFYRSYNFTSNDRAWINFFFAGAAVCSFLFRKLEDRSCKIAKSAGLYCLDLRPNSLNLSVSNVWPSVGRIRALVTYFLTWPIVKKNSTATIFDAPLLRSNLHHHHYQGPECLQVRTWDFRKGSACNLGLWSVRPRSISSFLLLFARSP